MRVSKDQVKLVCSYGGELKASPIGEKLIYCGGDTRLIIVNRNIKFDDLLVNLSFECGIIGGLKYQLPGEDPDVLVSLTSCEDLENMMLEYDRMFQNSQKTVRIRLFLDVEKTESDSGSDSGSESGSSSFSIPDYLFGFDKDEDYRNLCDDQALEEWKIPREHNALKPKSDDEGHVAAQLDKREGHVRCAGAAYPPVYGWQMAPTYIIVVPPPVVQMYWLM